MFPQTEWNLCENSSHVSQVGNFPQTFVCVKLFRFTNAVIYYQDVKWHRTYLSCRRWGDAEICPGDVWLERVRTFNFFHTEEGFRFHRLPRLRSPPMRSGLHPTPLQAKRGSSKYCEVIPKQIKSDCSSVPSREGGVSSALCTIHTLKTITTVPQKHSKVYCCPSFTKHKKRLLHTMEI